MTYLALFARVRVEGLDDAHGPGVDHVDPVAVPAPHHVVNLDRSYIDQDNNSLSTFVWYSTELNHPIIENDKNLELMLM